MKINAKRTERTKINGTRNVLTVNGKEPGYQYRIVNDTGDRVAMMQERGYEIVSDAGVKVGDRRVANPTQEGSPVMVSVGGGVKGVVMRIKDEWYEEDKQAKREQNDTMMASMKQSANNEGLYGKLEVGNS